MKLNAGLSFTLALLAGLAASAAPPDAGAQTTFSTATVNVSGTVSGQPESVAFSGRVTIASRVVASERVANEAAAVMLDIDLSGLSGVGLSTRTKYVTSARELPLRRLTTTDLVEISFPFHPAGSDPLVTSRTGVAMFSLLYDVNTGVLTAASANLSGP